MAYRNLLRKTSPRLAIMLALGIFLAPARAFADDKDDLACLLDEEVVNGASKTEELAKDAPGTTSVITAEDIRRYGIRSIAGAIDFLGMGLVTQNPLHSVEIGGRGVLLTADFGNHVLLVVDGHVMNEPWGGTAYFEQGAGIPMELIDHIELILGPGSVLYGGNAMIGVVNVVTKKASSYDGAHFVVEGAASPQQGSHGNVTSWSPSEIGGSYRVAAGFGHQLTLFGHPASLIAQLELYRQDGPTFLWGPQTVTNEDGSPKSFGARTPVGVWGGRINNQYSTSVPALFAKLEVGEISVMFRAASYSRRTPVAGFDQQQTDFDESASSERDRFLSLQAQWQTQVGRKLQLSVRGYGDLYDYLQHTYNSDPSSCGYVTTGPCVFVGMGHSRWLGSEVQGNYDWLGNGHLTTLVGFDGRVREVGGETDSQEASTGQTVDVSGKKSVTEVVWAAYAQQRWTPVPFLHLNAGGRYDDDPRGGARFSPRAAVAVDTWKNGVFKVSYSEAFRAPTFFEAFYEQTGWISNPEIHSETVRGAETSFEQRFGRHRIMFGGFRTWWTDLLQLRQIDDTTLQYQNASRIDNYGYNARVDGAIGNFRYGASITGAHTRRVTPDGTEALPVAPQLFGNARVSYQLPGYWPTVALSSTFVGPRPADRAFDGGFTPSPSAPASAEFRLTLTQQVPHVPGLSYRISGSFVTGSVAPYVAGPNQAVDPAGPATSAELTPVVRFTGFASLKYDLPL